jgi:hypothetical protein
LRSEEKRENREVSFAKREEPFEKREETIYI